MIPAKFDAIEKLREIRERSALSELEGCNRTSDLAEANAAQFEKNLQIQTATAQDQHAQLYNQIIGQQLSAGDLHQVRAQVDLENAELDHLSGQCEEARDAAIAAKADLAKARAKRMELQRAMKKWAALREREIERQRKAEAHREELRHEENMHHRERRW